MTNKWIALSAVWMSAKNLDQIPKNSSVGLRTPLSCSLKGSQVYTFNLSIVYSCVSLDPILSISGNHILIRDLVITGHHLLSGFVVYVFSCPPYGTTLGSLRSLIPSAVILAPGHWSECLVGCTTAHGRSPKTHPPGLNRKIDAST